jgi:hypothetical protein
MVLTVALLIAPAACRRSPAPPALEVDAYETNAWVGTTTTLPPARPPAPAAEPSRAATAPSAAPAETPRPKPRGFEPAKPW